MNRSCASISIAFRRSDTDHASPSASSHPERCSSSNHDRDLDSASLPAIFLCLHLCRRRPWSGIGRASPSASCASGIWLYILTPRADRDHDLGVGFAGAELRGLDCTTRSTGSRSWPILGAARQSAWPLRQRPDRRSSAPRHRHDCAGSCRGAMNPTERVSSDDPQAAPRWRTTPI